MTFQILLIVAAQNGAVVVQPVGSYSSLAVCDEERRLLDERLSADAGAVIATPALAYRTVSTRKS